MTKFKEYYGIFNFVLKSSIFAHCSTLQARKGFIDLLKETPDIDMYSHWDDVIPKIESEHRYLAVDNDLLREIFFIENKLDMVSITRSIH